jgi:hypothetical protein
MIVTTDFTEEAESNGDYMAVISNSRIPHCLPPNELLFSLCGGYEVTVRLAPGASADAAQKFMSQLTPSVRPFCL